MTAKKKATFTLWIDSQLLAIAEKADSSPPEISFDDFKLDASQNPSNGIVANGWTSALKDMDREKARLDHLGKEQKIRIEKAKANTEVWVHRRYR